MGLKLKVVKSSSQRVLPFHVFRHFCCKIARLVTNLQYSSSQTDGHTDDSIVPIADAAARDQLKILLVASTDFI